MRKDVIKQVEALKEGAPAVRLNQKIPRSVHMRIQELALADSKSSNTKVGIRDKTLEALVAGVESLERASNPIE